MRMVFAAVVLLLTAQAAFATNKAAEFICNEIADAEKYARCVNKADAVAEGATSRHQTSGSSGWSAFFWPVSWWVAYYAFGLILGSYVYRDARRRDWLFLAVRPFWWLVLVILDPAFGLLAYWLVHYSKLSQNYAEFVSSQEGG
ncbi:MAG: hypothetical protein H6953_08685 [Chromatiaceae bacterium]|nr:hypothetical protein [Chromatiaceae bacterium]MCP5315470.1 hypothetical protein [Chromatiaceae bacterium]